MVEIIGPAVPILLPVAAHVPDGFRHPPAVVDKIPVKGAERLLAWKVTEFHAFLEAALFHVALIEGCICAAGNGPVEGHLYIQTVLVAGIGKTGGEEAGLARRLGGKDEVRHVEER